MNTLLIFLAISLQMQVDSLCDQAYSQEEQGQFTEAIRLYQEALDLTPADSLEWQSIICNGISTEYFCIGDYQSAADYCYRGLQADETRHDSVGLSSSYNLLSAIMLQMARPEQAIEMAEAAVRIEEGLLSSGTEGDRRIVLSDRLGVLSEILTKTNRQDRALECSLRAVDLAKQVGHAGKLGIRLSQLGTIYTNLKQYKEAIPTLEEAIALLQQSGQVRSEILSLVPYSQALDEAGRRQEAIEAMKRCEALTYSTNMRETRLHALHELALMHQSAASRPYFDHFTSLRDSLYTAEMQEQISNWEVRYETEKKEQAIREQQATLHQQRIALVAAVMVVALLLLAVVLIDIIRKREKQVAEEKNRMVSILSHDLKSPTIAQQHALRQMEQGKIVPDHRMLRSLVQAQDAQVSLVLNMLDYARLEAGKVVAQPIALDLSDIADDVITLLAQQAADKQISLTRSGESSIVKTDCMMATTIMRNLVSNAIKYSPEGSTVHISITPNGFCVTDEGPGIEAPSKEKGTGLGLIICQRFASLCHATLTITPAQPIGSKAQLIFQKQ